MMSDTLFVRICKRERERVSLAARMVLLLPQSSSQWANEQRPGRHEDRLISSAEIPDWLLRETWRSTRWPRRYSDCYSSDVAMLWSPSLTCLWLLHWFDPPSRLENTTMSDRSDLNFSPLRVDPSSSDIDQWIRRSGRFPRGGRNLVLISTINRWEKNSQGSNGVRSWAIVVSSLAAFRSRSRTTPRRCNGALIA